MEPWSVQAPVPWLCLASVIALHPYHFPIVILHLYIVHSPKAQQTSRSGTFRNYTPTSLPCQVSSCLEDPSFSLYSSNVFSFNNLSPPSTCIICWRNPKLNLLYYTLTLKPKNFKSLFFHEWYYHSLTVNFWCGTSPGHKLEVVGRMYSMNQRKEECVAGKKNKWVGVAGL